MKGEGIRRLLFVLDFARRALWIPAFAGMTGDSWNGGGETVNGGGETVNGGGENENGGEQRE